jgi:hypothetical protein
MASFTKVLLSGSTQGKGIKVAATATAGTTIHTTGTSATVLDEIWLFATNNDTASIVLTIEFGSASTDDNIVLTIPSKAGETLVVPGLILRGNGSAGLTVAAFAATTNKITITGYINRIG